MPCPDAFDELGFPIQKDGASTVIPGLYFVDFLRKRKSSLLIGVGGDAGVVAPPAARGESSRLAAERGECLGPVQPRYMCQRLAGGGGGRAR